MDGTSFVTLFRYFTTLNSSDEKTNRSLVSPSIFMSYAMAISRKSTDKGDINKKDQIFSQYYKILSNYAISKILDFERVSKYSRITSPDGVSYALAGGKKDEFAALCFFSHQFRILVQDLVSSYGDKVLVLGTVKTINKDESLTGINIWVDGQPVSEINCHQNVCSFRAVAAKNQKFAVRVRMPEYMDFMDNNFEANELFNRLQPIILQKKETVSKDNGTLAENGSGTKKTGGAKKAQQKDTKQKEDTKSGDTGKSITKHLPKSKSEKKAVVSTTQPVKSDSDSVSADAQDNQSNANKPVSLPFSNEETMAFKVTAPSNWKGGLNQSGFSFSRDEEKGAERSYPAMCYSPAGKGVFTSVTGSVSARFTGIDIPGYLWGKYNPNDIRVYFQQNLKKDQVIHPIRIGRFKGYMRETPLRYKQGGCSSMSGFWNSNAAASGYGLLTNGKKYILIEYSSNAQGFFNDSDRAWVTSHAKTAFKEAKGIVTSIRISRTPERITTRYVRLPDISVALSSSIEKPGAGDLVDIQAGVSGLAPAESVTDYKWTGNLASKGDGNTKQVTFTASKAGKYTVSVTATTSKGRVVSESIIFEIKKPVVILEAYKKEIVMGDTVNLTAEVKDGGQGGSAWFLWQPYTDITFTPFEGASGKTKVTFPAPGNYKVWVELYQKNRSGATKLTESAQIEINVHGIDVSLNAEPSSPMVGQKVTVKAVVQQKIDPRLIRFVWESKGNIKSGAPAADGLSYSFMPVNTSPVTVSLKALAKAGNLKELASEAVTVTAGKYKVTVSEPKRLGPPPLKWDPQKKGIVEQPRSIAVFQNAETHCTLSPIPKEKLRYKWTVRPTGCSISAPGSKSTYLNAHKQGTYNISVTVSDKNGIELGKGTGVLTVTVSQRDLDVAKQKAKDLEKAKKLLTQGRKLWDKGELQQAIALIANAQKLADTDKEIARTLKAMQKQKQQLDDKLRQAADLIEQGKLEEAAMVLSSAATFNDKYPKYHKILRQLSDAKKNNQKKKKQEKLAEQLLRKVRKLWHEGRLSEAVTVLQEGEKQAAASADVSRTLKAMQRQKEQLDSKLRQAGDLLQQDRLRQAETVLASAAAISDAYPPYVELAGKLTGRIRQAEQIEKQRIQAAALLKQAKSESQQGKAESATRIVAEPSSGTTQPAKKSPKKKTITAKPGKTNLGKGY